MAAGADYIFCLQDKLFNFYKLDSTGNVVLSAQPYFLDFSPSGWDELAIQNIRNKKYWGVDRSVTVPLAYLNDGAKILKKIFYTDGNEQTVYLCIAAQQLVYTPGVRYGYWYKQIFRAEIDFTGFIHNSSRVTCTTLEDGLPKYLKSNENALNEYPMDVLEAVYIKMDGINLREGLQYINVDGLDIAVGIGNGQMIPCENVGSDGNSTGVLIASETYATVPINSNVFTAGLTNFMVKNAGAVAITFNVNGVVSLFCNQRTASVSFARIFLGITNQAPPNNSFPITPQFFINNVGQTFEYSYNQNITLQPNQALFMYAISTMNGTICTYQFTQRSKFNIGFVTRFQTTYIQGLRPQYLWNQIIGNLTDNVYSAFQSTYLNFYKNVVFTCGNAIRGKKDALMKISMNDFFQFWDSFDSVGIIDKSGKVDMLQKTDMVDVNNWIDIPGPNLDTFKVAMAKDYLYNELEIGYPELSNEVGLLNANDEFNTKFLFSLGTSKATGRLDKVSKVKAACYEIEKIRITTFQKDTTDNKADNDLFVVHIEDTLQPATGLIPAHYRLDRSLNPSATGLIEKDTVFNIFLSPKRNLLRNGNFLRSSLFRGDTRTLGYKTADKNSAMQAGGIVEKADVNIGSLNAPLFFPIYFDGEFPVTNNILDLLAINPLQVLRFPVDGTFYKGIIVKAAVSGNRTSSHAYQMLSTADNNLLNLIDYYG